jgi:hypothetical protein
MRIQFTRSGGLSGLLTQVQLDLGELPDDERAELEHLVEDARFFAQPSRQRGPRPDAFQYIIVVERGDERHEVLADERAMAAELRPLVERLTRLARR